MTEDVSFLSVCRRNFFGKRKAPNAVLSRPSFFCFQSGTLIRFPKVSLWDSGVRKRGEKIDLINLRQPGIWKSHFDSLYFKQCQSPPEEYSQHCCWFSTQQACSSSCRRTATSNPHLDRGQLASIFTQMRTTVNMSMHRMRRPARSVPFSPAGRFSSLHRLPSNLLL